MLQAHYRSILDFSDDALLQLKKDTMEALATLKQIKASPRYIESLETVLLRRHE
jgi:cysteinyl-tRNA synthetase